MDEFDYELDVLEWEEVLGIENFRAQKKAEGIRSGETSRSEM